MRSIPARAAVAGITLLALAAGACGENSAPPSVADGRTLYEENGCANCHGATGHGDGRLSGTLNPRPRNFHDPAAFKKGTDESAIAATLAEGLSRDSQMPRFVHLTEWERRSLALFVISLRTPSPSTDKTVPP